MSEPEFNFGVPAEGWGEDAAEETTEVAVEEEQKEEAPPKPRKARGSKAKAEKAEAAAPAMTKQVRKLEKVKIFISSRENHSGYEVVKVNGITTQIQTGVDADVKPGVFEVLDNSVQKIPTFRNVADPKGGTMQEMHIVERKPIPFQVKGRKYSKPRLVPDDYVLGPWEEFYEETDFE